MAHLSKKILKILAALEIKSTEEQQAKLEIIEALNKRGVVDLEDECLDDLIIIYDAFYEQKYNV